MIIESKISRYLLRDTQFVLYLLVWYDSWWF